MNRRSFLAGMVAALFAPRLPAAPVAGRYALFCSPSAFEQLRASAEWIGAADLGPGVFTGSLGTWNGVVRIIEEPPELIAFNQLGE